MNAAGFQHSVMQRNATEEFLCNKKVLHTFYATADAATVLAALRKQIETTSIFFRNAGWPEANLTNQL